jgi:type IV pilus assembly protein PilE
MSLRSRAAGLTVLELMIVTCVVTIFLVLMMPSFRGEVLRVRRADALQAIDQVHQGQERWRAQQPAYAASLADLGLAASSPAGHYSVNVATDTASQSTRYVISATASGAQAGDALCRHLRMVVDGGLWQESSGPDASYGNDDTTNRRCWGRR